MKMPNVSVSTTKRGIRVKRNKKMIVVPLKTPKLNPGVVCDEATITDGAIVFEPDEKGATKKHARKYLKQPSK